MEAALVAGAAPAGAAGLTVRGAWLITPKTAAGPAGFQAVAAFAAGGVFITIGSDEDGTGLGEWTSPSKGHFAFTYLNFHFGSDGSLSNTVKVAAAGTFKAKSLTGHATLTAVDPTGNPLFPPQHFSFTGKRIAIESP